MFGHWSVLCLFSDFSSGHDAFATAVVPASFPPTLHCAGNSHGCRPPELDQKESPQKLSNHLFEPVCVWRVWRCGVRVFFFFFVWFLCFTVMFRHQEGEEGIPE